LVTGANVTQIKHSALKLSDVASTKSPIKGDKVKVGDFSCSSLKLHYWLSLRTPALSGAGLRASSSDSSSHTGHSKPISKKITKKDW